MTSATAAKSLSHKTLRERERRWDKLVTWGLAALLAAAVGALWGWSRFSLDAPALGRHPGGGTAVGLALGVLTVALYGFAAAYSWRHRRRRQQYAMTRTWMDAHLALGLVAGLAALLHAGPRLGAPAHGAFLITFLALIGTGVLGRVLSVVIPRRLTRLEDEAMLVEDVVARQAAMRAQVEELLADADDSLVKLANDVVPAHIRSPDWYGARRMHHDDVVEAVWVEMKGDGLVAAEKRDWLRRVTACLVEERFLTRMLTYHYVLRAWLPVHVALTTLCLPWLVFHVITVLLL